MEVQRLALSCSFLLEHFIKKNIFFLQFSLLKICYLLALLLFSISMVFHYDMSCVVRKPDFGICENKDADQLRSNCAADQRLSFPYTDSTIPLLPKSEISSL